MLATAGVLWFIRWGRVDRQDRVASNDLTIQRSHKEQAVIYDLAHRKTALLVIDVQGEYFDPAGPAYAPAGADALSQILNLISEFRSRDMPMIFIQHLHRANGSDIGRMADFAAPDEPDSFIEGTPRAALLDELGVTDTDIVVRKCRYNSFHGTDLDSILRTLGIRAVAITGLMTSFCCETTARDAHARDYEVLFVADANAGPDLQHLDGTRLPHTEVLEHTMAALAAGFAEIVTTAQLVTRLG
jgi:biuret amidohydrolase